jgi:hypothetical protein
LPVFFKDTVADFLIGSIVSLSELEGHAYLLGSCVRGLMCNQNYSNLKSFHEELKNTRGEEKLKSGTNTNWIYKTEKCEYTKVA